MCPLELTETPDASPKYRFGGSCNGLGTDSNAILGTGCCANADGAISNRTPASQCRIVILPSVIFLLAWMLVDGRSVCTCRPRHDGYSSRAWPCVCISRSLLR